MRSEFNKTLTIYFESEAEIEEWERFLRSVKDLVYAEAKTKDEIRKASEIAEDFLTRLDAFK